MDTQQVIGMVLNALISLCAAGGFTGLLLYRANKRHRNSEAEVNEANANMLEGNLTISLSQETQNVLKIYKDSAADARKEAAEAKQVAILDRKRLDFLISYLRSQQIAVPDFPEELR